MTGFMSRLSHRDRRALFLGLAIIAPAAVVVLGVRPYRAALVEAQERVAAERDLLARELELLEGRDGLPAELERARRDAQVADLRLVEAVNEVVAEAELTDLLEAWAVRSHVLMEEIRREALPRGEEPPPDVTPIRLAVSGESDLQGVMTFLDGIETGSLLIRVRGLALEPVTGRPGTSNGQSDPLPTGVVEFQLIVEGYARLDEVVGSQMTGR